MFVKRAKQINEQTMTGRCYLSTRVQLFSRMPSRMTGWYRKQIGISQLVFWRMLLIPVPMGQTFFVFNAELFQYVNNNEDGVDVILLCHKNDDVNMFRFQK